MLDKKDIKTTEENDFKLSKKKSYANNNCLLSGIDLGRVIEFNKGLPISLSQKELEANGVIFTDKGMILPYRWMEVTNG